MEGIRAYKQLIFWQKAHHLTKDVLGVVRFFPSNPETNMIKRQLARSVASIPANIAEGYGGSKGAAYRHYLLISRRTAYETDYWLLLSYELGYLSLEQYSLFAGHISEIAALLTATIKKLSS